MQVSKYGVALVLLLVALQGCTTASSPRPTSKSKAEAATADFPPRSGPPAELLWYRTAAEQRAIYQSVYRAAEAQLPTLIDGRPAGSWAVVLDADETVLNNSDELVRAARTGETWSEPVWEDWVRLKKATDLPGARAFIEKVRSLGGRAIIVTNREEDVCDETRDNLKILEIQVDGVLCAPDGVSDKNDRFRAIETGKTTLGLQALAIVAFVGDNIKDFPGRTQQDLGDLTEFGRKLFVLPNPVYGSWTKNDFH